MMLDAYDKGEFDVLMVTETSRLTRRLVDILDVRPPRRDIRILVLRQGIDTASSDLGLKMLIIVAEEEVKIKAARAARYAIERRGAGHPTAGMTPHGYRWVPADLRDTKGTRYVLNEDEAQDVRQIFREFLAGGSLGQIARDLTTAGRRTRAGARWHTSTVHRVLLNPLYAALLPPAQPSGEHNLKAVDIEACTPGAWEPIIASEALRATRAKLLHVKPNHDGNARRWLLSGLAICSVCKQPARSARGETHPTTKKDGSGTAPSLRYHAYRCTQGHFMRNGDMIDQWIAALIVGRLSEPEYLLKLGRHFKPEAGRRDIGVLNAERDALLGQRVTLARLVARGMPETEALEGYDEIDAQLRAITAEIAQAVQQNPLAELAGIDDVSSWWRNATLARKRAAVELLMDVEIKPVGQGKRVTTPQAAEPTVNIKWKV
jgi:DNA invertase Pin-like site-specific DNA recombinase